MNKNRKSGLGLIGMTFITAAALLATTAGSLAWYAYSRTAYFSFQGTSVTKSALLNVGIVDDDHYLSDDELIEFDLTREEHDGHSILFTQSMKGLSVDAIRRYLFYSPYAVDKLFPVTTQARSIDDDSDLTLYKSPDYGNTTLDLIAETNEYVKIPFAFKIINDDAQYVPGVSVWLTEAVAQTSGVDIHNALRIYVEGDEEKFLMKPADLSTNTGSTKVGGVLDLDGDGTYDYDRGYGKQDKEFVYGQFDGTISHSTDPYGIPFEDAELDDVNGVGDVSEASTFLAKHNEIARTADLSNATAKVAEYETFGTVNPSIDERGDYYAGETGIPLASTNSGSKIGYTTMTIFIEGWDHSVIDKAAGYSFNLGLRFEINRI